MKSKNITNYVLFTILGLLILGAGAYLFMIQDKLPEIIMTLPFVCMGIGSGIFGQNLGTVITILSLKNHPQKAKEYEIEEKDERNVAIRNKAKAKAYDLMVMVYGALLLILALANASLSIILTSVAAYLFVTFSNFYYLIKYNKEL